MPIRLHAGLSPAGAQAALKILADAERQAAAELVDEGERQRLHELLKAGRDAGSTPATFAATHASWRPFIGDVDDVHAAYGGLLLPEAGSSTAVAELVVLPGYRRHGVGSALLDHLAEVAREDGATELSVWARDDDASRAFASGHGYTVDRRLDGLGRSAAPVDDPVVPTGREIRAYRPGPDDQGLVDTLNEAFLHNPDRTWSLEGLAERRRRPWFKDAGVFVATDAEDQVVGVHITKDRGDAVGEVHVLGVHPKEHGTGLGRALLRTGLQHLQDVVHASEVILWMEHDNKAARGLYVSEGFEQRWSDVSYARKLT